MTEPVLHLERRRGSMPEPGVEAPRTSDGLRLLRHDAVQVAAREVCQTWRNDRGEAVDRTEVDATVLLLANAVEEYADGRTPSRPPPTVLSRYLLEELRAAVVRFWSEKGAEPGAMRVLTMMRAFESVRVAIAPNWDEYFSSRMSGPDGLDLVVEVAHDLRSPLTSILFLAETISRGQSGDVTELQKRQLRLIYSAALGLSTMASDVIELARGGDHLVEKDESPFSITETLDSVAEMVRPIAEEKGLLLSFAPPQSDYRLGRPLALSRVLLNLTTNALKFTDVGVVEITTKPIGLSKMEFAVLDTGHGISDEALASLYQPFRRSRARTGRGGYCFSGTGLGLAICRKLVNVMGGELKFETRLGSGTRFWFVVDMPPATHM